MPTITPQISLIHGVNFPELLAEGWAKSRSAGAMTPAQPYTYFGKGYYRAMDAYPDEIWVEPTHGVLMCRPNVLRKEYFETDPSNYWGYQSTLLSLSKWNFNDPYIIPTNISNDVSKVTNVGRKNKGYALIELLTKNALAALIAQQSLDMVPIMETKENLVDNEGWSCWIHPPGTFTDRAADYMLIAFGLKYCLHIQMNGIAKVYVHIQDKSTSIWNLTATFNFGQQGVQHNKPFQLTVIPWGLNYITFIFSQSDEGNSSKQFLKFVSAASQGSYASFLYDIKKLEQSSPKDRWDTGTKQYIKIPAGPLAVAVRRYLHNYGFTFGRVRYDKGPAKLALAPEMLSRPLGTTPTITPIGLWGALAPDVSVTGISTSITNEAYPDKPFDRDVDTQIVAHFVLQASGDGVYTPELWGVDYNIDAQVFNPSWPTKDWSNRWSLIRFRKTVEPDVSDMEVKLEHADDDFVHLYHGWGPVQLKVSGTEVFSGYIRRRQPTLKYRGSTRRAIVNSNVTSHDMWQRLNNRFISDFTYLSNRPLGDVLVDLLKRGGFKDTDINAETRLNGIVFPGFENPNDDSSIVPDGKIGDVIREILKAYSAVPIRVRWTGVQWKIYMAPQYDNTTVPAHVFFAYHPVDNSGKLMSDDARYSKHWMKILSDMEFTIEEPPFNSLIGKSTTTASKDAEAIAASIPAIYVEPKSLSDPNYFYFQGHEELKIIQPPEIPTTTTQDDLNIATRTYWDRYHRPPMILEVKAEWQPFIDVDDFIEVFGNDNQGVLVSYGIFRIDSEEVQITLDSNSGKDRRWNWDCSYCFRYVGKSNKNVVGFEDVPMFSNVLPVIP